MVVIRWELGDEFRSASGESVLFADESNNGIGLHLGIPGIWTRASIFQIYHWIAVDNTYGGVYRPHRKVMTLAAVECAYLIFFHMVYIP